MLRHIGLLYEEVHSSCGYPELCGGGVIHENVVKRKPERLRRNLRNAPIVLNLTVYQNEKLIRNYVKEICIFVGFG